MPRNTKKEKENSSEKVRSREIGRNVLVETTYLNFIVHYGPKHSNGLRDCSIKLADGQFAIESKMLAQCLRELAEEIEK